MSLISDYLWHGYVPPRTIPEWLWQGISAPLMGAEYTAKGASRQLDKLFDRLCDKHPGPHCVPLSGGWDSRLILGALCERVGPREICTISFGCPGQLDFEIGHKVASRMGVRYHNLNLQDLRIEWPALISSVRQAPWTYVPDGYVFCAMLQQAKTEVGASTIWSGFLGDPLTGGHAKRSRSDEPKATWYERFAEGERRVKDAQMAEPNYAPSYPDLPECVTGPFVQHEWLDFGVRQRACIAPIVLPGKTWREWSAEQGAGVGGVQIVTPYCDAQWAGYWLHAPRDLHIRQRLYLAMAYYKFPHLFCLPSKYSLGLARKAWIRQEAYRVVIRVRNAVHRRFPILRIRSGLLDNYADYQLVFRSRDDYRTAMDEAIRVLKEREAIPWLDLNSMRNEHLKGKRDHSEALLVLLGLALNLEAHK